MEKENILFIFALVGCAADIIATIFLFINTNISIGIFILVLILFIGLFVLLYQRYIEKCNFIKFIEYLFDNSTHNFNLLPKVCLALDKYNKTNNLNVQNLSIKYTYDMSAIDLDSISPNSEIEYTDTIEYNFNCENKNIPNEFICYLGNMYADNRMSEISQKHGIQDTYQTVPPPRYTDETYVSSIIQKYCWQLKKENITKSNLFPLSFKLKCQEKTKENSIDTIIFYPKQYAKRIDKVKFDIIFICNNRTLDKVQLFKVWKDGKNFKHTPVSESSNLDNSFSVTIEPNSSKYEAYYLQIHRKLVSSI